MILLLVWDGLRPDMITAELTPHLYALANQGTICQDSHAAFPTATRINAASLSTGCYPGRHGLVDNELYVAALDSQRPVSCADWRVLARMAELEGQRLLSVPTLGEMLRDAGKRMASGGSGSPGTTYLTNPEQTGPIINWAHAWPGAVHERIGGQGAFLDDTSTSFERNDFVIRTLLDTIIPNELPDLLVLWLTEPDHVQHEHGLLSLEARKTLRRLDGDLKVLLTHLEEIQGVDALTCFLVSDHGFSTVIPIEEPEEELVAAGLKKDVTSNDIVRGLSSLYLNGRAKTRVADLLTHLAGCPWVGGFYLRDDLLERHPHAMPQSAVFGYHRRSAEIMFSYAWTGAQNREGVAGQVMHPAPMAAIHGSASPYALNNCLVAWGKGIKPGCVSQVPCGIVDLAPTVLRLLGVETPQHLDGRVLHELLEDGPRPEDLAITRTIAEAVYPLRSGETRRQRAHYSEVAGHRYLDRVVMSADS